MNLPDHETKIIIQSINGRILYKGTGKGTTTLSFNEYPNGLYLVTLIDAHHSLTQKVIKH